MPIYTDQLKRLINIELQPNKIISIVPSQTELLFDLGLDNEVIGITKFCIHPNEWFKTKIRVGGTKNINIHKIIELQPNLIIANKEENTKEDIEKLEQIAPIWISDINNLESALIMIKSIGEITSTTAKAEQIVLKIKESFDNLISINSQNKISCCYLIWQNPYMTIGVDTFINNMLKHCNLTNVFANENRYPIITNEILIAANPSVVMLSSEPFPFKEKHIAALQIILPKAKIVLVDGEMFSWYGSRLLQAPKYFTQLLQTIVS